MAHHKISRRLVLGATATTGLAAPSTLRAQAPQVKIGVLTDMSSVYSDYAGQGSVEAARLAIADSGIQDRVQLVSADHQNKPDVGSICDGVDGFEFGAESRTSAKSALANAGGMPTGADRMSIALRHV